jgi:hypothetical protein
VRLQLLSQPVVDASAVIALFAHQQHLVFIADGCWSAAVVRRYPGPLLLLRSLAKPDEYVTYSSSEAVFEIAVFSAAVSVVCPCWFIAVLNQV